MYERERERENLLLQTLISIEWQIEVEVRLHVPPDGIIPIARRMLPVIRLVSLSSLFSSLLFSLLLSSSLFSRTYRAGGEDEIQELHNDLSIGVLHRQLQLFHLLIQTTLYISGVRERKRKKGEGEKERRNKDDKE